MIAYCDANALIKLVVAEPDGDEVVHLLTSVVDDGATMLTSSVSRLEIRRALMRIQGPDTATDEIDRQVRAATDFIDVESVDEHTIELAGLLPVRNLGSLDAIHVATALRSGCDLVITRDAQMRRACEVLGIAVA